MSEYPNDGPRPETKKVLVAMTKVDVARIDRLVTRCGFRSRTDFVTTACRELAEKCERKPATRVENVTITGGDV